MRRQITMYAVLIGLCLSANLACGPNCPKVKAKMSDTELAKDDAARVNDFVKRRKTLMDQAKGGGIDEFSMQRLKFSVTAYELAIQLQLRIIELAAASKSYKSNLEEINNTRCLLDDVLKAKLIQKDDITISDGTGKTIQEKHALFKQLFGNEGEPSKYDLIQYYKSGIKLKKDGQVDKAASEEGEGAEAESGADMGEESAGGESESAGEPQEEPSGESGEDPTEL